MNQDILFSIVLIATAIGFFAWGMLINNLKIQVWRIRWIELEHDTARLLGREPRNIDEVFPKNK
jgi:hypothetical protein